MRKRENKSKKAVLSGVYDILKHIELALSCYWSVLMDFVPVLFFLFCFINHKIVNTSITFTSTGRFFIFVILIFFPHLFRFHMLSIPIFIIIRS